MCASLERSALIDISLVRDLMAVHRRRLGHQQDPLDTRGGSRIRLIVSLEAPADELLYLRPTYGAFNRWICTEILQSSRIGPRQQRDIRFVVSANDAVGN